VKITAIETQVLPRANAQLDFRQSRDESTRPYGWSEATLEWHTRAVVGAIEDISQLLIGEDPRRIEHLWQLMYRQHFWHGNGIVRGTAMSGIDIGSFSEKFMAFPAINFGADVCAISSGSIAISAAARWKNFTKRNARTRNVSANLRNTPLKRSPSASAESAVS
jgi:hypothetical protein